MGGKLSPKNRCSGLVLIKMITIEVIILIVSIIITIKVNEIPGYKT